MIDENAFGLLVGWHGVEDEEYGSEPEEFVDRLRSFRAVTRDYVREHPLGQGVLAVELGHALYLELGDGDQSVDPITWIRGVRAQLGERDFETVGIVVHGGRWSHEPGEVEAPPELPGGSFVALSLPSEPLRRALAAESAAQGDPDEDGAWGPGLYLDEEALDALGKKLKNIPTALEALGSTFYRVTR